jgi:hypothetical protein
MNKELCQKCREVRNFFERWKVVDIYNQQAMVGYNKIESKKLQTKSIL